MSEINFTITDAALIPDELCTFTLQFSLDKSPSLFLLSYARSIAAMNLELKLERVPSNERIRAALAQPCPVCEGEGWILDNTFPDDGEVRAHCEWCGGTKTASVPGVRRDEPRPDYVCATPVYNGEVAAANARLIAAAPELLEVAELVVEFFGTDPIEDLLDADIRLRDTARAAIAKAGGA